MSLNFCDLLVLGSDLSGIMAATLLAKRGMNVLVLDDDDDSQPMPNVAIGLGSRSFKSLLGKLMIPDSKLQMLTENRVGCQVVFPKHRFDISKSRPTFLKEVQREFPEEKELVEEVLKEADFLRDNYLDQALVFFPIESGKDKKLFAKWLETLPAEKIVGLWKRLSPTIRSLFEAQLRFFSRGPLMDPPVFQLMMFLPPEQAASYSIKGGARDLKKLFFDKLDYFGGMVHPLSGDTFQIVTKGRDVKGIQLSRYNFPTRCRYLLGNTNVQSIYSSMPSDLLSFLFGGREKRKINSLEPIEEYSIVQYELPKDVLPSPMKENVIVINDATAPLEGSNFLEINLNPLPKSSNEFDTLMTVSYPTRPEHQHSHEDILKEIDAKLRRIIPFANSHLRRTFPMDSQSSGKIISSEELFPTEANDAEMKSYRKKVSFPPSFFHPTISSPYKNLFMVGPDILSWMGMEGKMLSALRAVELIWNTELKVRNS